jgi:Rieske Fe-S protein
MTDRPQPLLHRRTIAGIATIGVGLPVLAACSGSDGSDVANDPNTPSPSSTPTASESAEASSSESAGESTGGADAFAQTSDIEVGGGTIFPEDQVVITQPADGEFKCFSAVCTHQGCIVSSVSDGNINCECHGSAFSIADGSVVTGPATSPLAEQQIAVDGDAITLG